jgi:hypothetical protein
MDITPANIHRGGAHCAQYGPVQIIASLSQGRTVMTGQTMARTKCSNSPAQRVLCINAFADPRQCGHLRPIE